MSRKAEVLGLKINLTNKEGLIDIIRGLLSHSKSNHMITLNPEMVVRAQKDKNFKKIIESADIVIPDGIGIILALKSKQRLSLNHKKREDKKIEWNNRIPGTDLIYELARSLCNEARFFLFGGKDDVVQKAAGKLCCLFPGLKIAGIYAGYRFRDSELVKKINQSGANILLVGLGSPKQEEWIRENLKKLSSVRLAIGIGGAFDFISGEVRRAPLWMCNMGLEWLWRLLKQPWRLIRIYRAAVVFPYLVLRDEIFKK